MALRGDMGKKLLFLACRSVRNSFLKFLIPVLVPQTGPQGQKNLNLASRLIFFPGPRNGKEASPIIFLGFLGCTIRCIISAPGALITKLAPPLKRPRGPLKTGVRRVALVLSRRVKTVFSRKISGKF